MLISSRTEKTDLQEGTMAFAITHILWLGLALAPGPVAGRGRRADAVQDRHLRAGRDHLPGLDGGGRRLLREGRAQGRGHQHGRRHARPAGAALRRDPGHACGLAPAVLANKQGADLRLITSTCNTIPITMFSKAGVGMGDLKGKTFGISTFGSETDIAISILLKQQGLTRRTSRFPRSAAARSASPRWSRAASMSRR